MIKMGELAEIAEKWEKILDNIEKHKKEMPVTFNNIRSTIGLFRNLAKKSSSNN